MPTAPGTTQDKTDKTDKTPAPAASAAPAAEGKPDAPAAEGKPRNPPQDYGFRTGAKITVTDKTPTFKGRRAVAYEKLVSCNGKTVEDFKASDPPLTDKESFRGWLRLFVREGYATLSGGEEKKPPAPAEPEPTVEDKGKAA